MPNELPRLSWPGRAPLPPTDGPAPQLMRQVAPSGLAVDPTAAANRLYHGDNLAVMDSLLATLTGGVDLIYVDPPFCSGDDYVVAGPDGEDIAFSDRWQGGLSTYVDWLAPRLERMRALLAPHGSLYVHLDPTASHYIKVLLDEIFGRECFQREIIWRIGWVSGYKTQVRNWVRNHDVLLFYTRSASGFTFNRQTVPAPAGYRRRGGGEAPGRPIEDVWNANEAERALSGADSLDSIQIKSFSREKTGYRTQKNESLVRRVVAASSNPGDLVADFFCGSGTTAAACEQLGRRWLLCDSGAAAITVTARRLQAMPLRRPFEVWSMEASADGDIAPAAQTGGIDADEVS